MGTTIGRILKAVLNVGARLMLDAVEVSSRGNLECTPFRDATNACRKKMEFTVGVIGFRVTDDYSFSGVPSRTRNVAGELLEQFFNLNSRFMFLELR
ncbi:hypothetical protein [Burkholderia ubonensis]|uniref:hypothetical protein n=1 Tax=Burkholderia ubonensis TaxID=101571 RepID=UPI0012FCD506|nr:hypothetical protein [Burkholderia ubonensis]